MNAHALEAVLTESDLVSASSRLPSRRKHSASWPYELVDLRIQRRPCRPARRDPRAAPVDHWLVAAPPPDAIPSSYNALRGRRPRVAANG